MDECISKYHQWPAFSGLCTATTRSRGKVGGPIFRWGSRRPGNLQWPAGFKTFICPTPSPPPLQVHLFSLHTHTPLLFLHPDTRREGSSISNPTSDPLVSPILPP